MDILNRKQENFCENAGIAGVLLSITCLIQHLVFMVPGWLTYSILIVYCMAIAGFVMLARKSHQAFWLLLAAAILLFIVTAFMILIKAFSLVVPLLLIYTVIIVAVLSLNGIQPSLKEKWLHQKSEDEKWNGII